MFDKFWCCFTLLAIGTVLCITHPSIKVEIPFEEKNIPLISVAFTHDNLQYVPRMLRSIDFDVRNIQLHIGNFNETVRSIIHHHINVSIDDAPKYLKGKVHVTESPFNFGCARGMNLGMKAIAERQDSWGIIANSDIWFKPGSLFKLYTHMATPHNYPDIAFVNLAEEASWSMFVATTNLIQNVGYFDENIYPMFYEDDEYSVRIRISGLNVIRFPDVHVGHGEGDGATHYVSGTIRLLRGKFEPSRLSYTFNQTPFAAMVKRGGKANANYFHRKWGANTSKHCKNPEHMHDCFVEFTTPFNCTGASPRDWKVWEHRMDYLVSGIGSLKNATRLDLPPCKYYIST